ncbi:MAG: phytanoyl-CoA dioxygenase family protein [Planctomycetes bacterium]|nr:phytanoyl-CoA dioxygenase family protein [Planctomycetota bacterium]
MSESSAICDQVLSRGFATLVEGLTKSEVDALVVEVDAATGSDRAGLRNLFRLAPSVCSLPRHPVVSKIVAELLGTGAFAVRAILFDKTPMANWKVAWHQDHTIAVANQAELQGYGPWSTKDGVLHVQPPVEVLDGMLAVRIHLDDCGPKNGPLRVLPGSHRHGRLDRSAVEDWQQCVSPVTCVVPLGGLVVMRPLLLHASSIAEAASRRRVIHVEFASTELAPPLQWYERVG